MPSAESLDGLFGGMLEKGKGQKSGSQKLGTVSEYRKPSDLL